MAADETAPSSSGYVPMFTLAMAQSNTEKPQRAFDGVIPPTASDAEKAVNRTRMAADDLSKHIADTRTVGESNRTPLDEMDAAIAEGADEVIESVFASVEDLLGDIGHDDDFNCDHTNATDEGAAKEEDAALRAGDGQGEKNAHADAPGDGRAQSEPSVESEVEPPCPQEDEAELEATAPVAAKQESVDQAPVHTAPQPAGHHPKFWHAAWRKLRTALSALRAAPLASIVRRLFAAPLRLVPEAARPYVDWIALSLVFWIPVVWVIALYVIGR